MKEKARAEDEPRQVLDQLLSVPMVLEMLGKPSMQTFKNLRQSGEFPEPVRYRAGSKRIYWRKSELIAWLASRPR